ncbi:peroxiredoxin 2-like isoform X2 [Megachile rotundata]|uniref:peroxiredoxin 2-like isoform X2 n=1 Tax=Megachile rotundata TaxID=143995 RepID=UPI003FD313AB
MTTFDQLFGRKSVREDEHLCCGEQQQEPQEEPEVLTDYKGRYLVLLFYPYDFTFFCPTEMIQFSDRIKEFGDIDCSIVAISTDSQYTHLAWIMTPRKQGGLGEMHMPVLADKNQNISRTYGVLDENEGVALKGLFIIDKRQLIRHISISEISLSRSVDETLRLLQACQFVDKFGSTCPAGPKESHQCVGDEPNFFDSK